MSVTSHPAQLRRDIVDAGDDALLLRSPELRDGAVRRTPLVNRLRTRHVALVTLLAPAGYGKTTALALWARRDPRRFVWVTLESGQDHDSLAGLLVAGVAGEDENAAAAARSAIARGPRTAARRIGALALSIGEPIVIVLDRIEELDGEDARTLVALLAENLPPNAELAVAGRKSPKVPVARLRAEGRLLELDASDLKFSEREAAALLHTFGVDLDPEALKDLHLRTEGWPVGLAMCGLALEPSPGKRRRAPASITGAHHFVAGYFAEEVLAQLGPELAEFATESSLLDRMNNRICDEVLGRSDSARLLAELANAHAFVIPVDREHTWFRFHELFRDSLRRRLAQGDWSRFVDLSKRAATWYARAGDVSTALHHLLALGEHRGAVQLLGTMLPEICSSGAVSLVGMLDQLEREELLREDQPAAVAGALVHAMAGEASAATRWAALAECGRAGDADASFAVMGAALCHDGPETMRVDATAALEHLPPQSPVVPFALLLLGVAHVLLHEPAAAETALVDAADRAGANAPMVASAALAELSLLAQEAEDWSRAEELARAARDSAEVLAAEGNVFAIVAYVASARSALRNSNWVRAGADIQCAYELLPRANDGLGWLAIQARTELIRAHLALNDIAAADGLATQIHDLVVARPQLETACADAHDLRARIDTLRDGNRPGSGLTAAEFRLLPLLTTHLTFRQIAEHLYVSRNTVKTQAISVYRKLGVSSRTEAIDEAIALGLLKPDREAVIERRE
ncbi:MAG TPA: LuxR C-terminal-related transcriptional regulator [Gaiellaceae bacterium]|jgi:LuxR family maltose regulon positive regulatory protein|nr:LuxR C-terminal-related transcriptional regulator [Gaiellaceae bacterium]